MANDHIPNDPYRASDPDAPYRTKPRSDPADDRAMRLDNELQVDPELAEGPAGGNRIALYALAIAVVLGAVFYGLNNSSIKEASTTPATPATTAQNAAPATAQNTAPATAQNAAPGSPPAAPPGVRDVTPRANSQPGMTTGAASSTPTPSPNPKSADPKAPSDGAK
jgi:hypothetical protein